MAIKLILTIVLILWSANCFSAISFTNGLWSTSFVGCEISEVNAAWTCDGLESGDVYNCDGDCPHSVVSSTQNYSSGGGGNGYGMYFEGNDRNIISTPMRITFPSTLQKFWIRFYMRLPSGQNIGSAITEHKILYLYTTAGTVMVVQWPYYNAYGLEGLYGSGITYVYGDGSSTHNQYGDTTGYFSTIYNSGNADGTWHCFEFYFDFGTTTSNGVFRFWIDGVNTANDTAVNFVDSGGAGFSYFDLPLNHNVWTLEPYGRHDFDDIAIATDSYTGLVQNTSGFATGLDMIGPLDFSEAPATVNGGITYSGCEFH